jgi:hypothetical protein
VSTPPEQRQPPWRPVLEPTHVVRRRRTEALAELIREFRENEGRPRRSSTNRSSSMSRRPPSTTRRRSCRPYPPAADDGLTLRRTALVVGVTAAALTGFGAALLLPGPGADGAAQGAAALPHRSSAAVAPAGRQSTDPDGPGTVREGDSGPEVTELQQRLLRVPDVYDHGSTDGRYDATLAAAVARFQLWYGIRGDETGVYGNDTRRDLVSRTTL